MAERRRNRKRPEADSGAESPEVIDKLEYDVAKYLKSKLPQKQTSFLGHKVDYFIASKAIDLLMESKWAKADKRTDETKFPTRESVVDFMNDMLAHKFFHRVKTIIVKKEVKAKKAENESTDESHDNNKKTKGSVEKSPEAKRTNKKDSKEKEKKEKKEKKKVKFDMHAEQIFLDANEPFVWIYDYIPMKTWLIGGGLVFAAIAICLFPLWPRTVRNYVYYLSIAAAAFLFFIIALAVLKMVVFAVVWVVTFGKHHLWILPNLTEDVGFFESFWPLYKHEYKPKGSDTDKSQEDEKGKKDDDNDAEKDQDRDSEAESVATTESGGGTRSTNGFEILDSNDLNDE